jgi:uncharacterized protein
MAQPVSSTFKVRVAKDSAAGREPVPGDEIAVTAKLDAPAARRPGSPFLVLAHGANNDLDFPLLVYIARRLAELEIVCTVRFNFPYVERGHTSPDARPVLEHTFCEVYDHVVRELAGPGAPVFIGGKSLGGRAACELVSRHAEGSGLPAAGLIVLGYPLHKPGHKDELFRNPLRHIDVPSLFCIGSRDPLCDPALLGPVLRELATPGDLYVVEHGDHSLHVPAPKGGQIHVPASEGRHPEDSYEPVTQRIAAFVSHALGTA